jgi:hypothetical protein
MAEFVINPHVKSILIGRNMGKEDRLLCAATTCIFVPEGSPDPNFGRDIEVQGHAECPRCKYTTSWQEGKEWIDSNRRTIMRCKVCKKIIPKKNIVWTQKVISKHRKTKHTYYHKQCWDAMFCDCSEEDEQQVTQN